MIIDEISLRDTGRFSRFLSDYLEESNSRLKEFYGQFPRIENFRQQIDSRSFDAENRRVLCETLASQYAGIAVSQAVEKNLNKLAEKTTYTVTTGHQLNIFTGPLYFIYKIATTIATCRKLQLTYPQYHFVPVYWMASEDHDREEIDHFTAEGKTYTWQTDQQGAVGRFDTKGLEELARSFPGMPPVFVDAYKTSGSLADACRTYVNRLFGEHGLIVIDGDAKALKQLFVPIITDDIVNHTAQSAVGKTTASLEKSGYKTPVYARAINFFYLRSGLRERIEKTGSTYRVLNSPVSFNEEEIDEEIRNHPERFSPNVVLRPLYQETVLPNLAYIGGPAEVAYWFQLKGVFTRYHMPFPILMPRNFAVLLTGNVIKKAKKTGLNRSDFFKPRHKLHNALTLKTTDKDLLLNDMIDKTGELFDRVRSQAATVDHTLVAHVEAQRKQMIDKLKGIEKKIIRAEKRNYKDQLRQIDDVLDYLFPGGVLQERKENFIPFYLTNENLINNLTDHFDPFNFNLYFLECFAKYSNGR